MPLANRRVFFSHSQNSLSAFFDAGALADLRGDFDVRANDSGMVLSAGSLRDAAGSAAVIVTDWFTPVSAAFFSDCARELAAVIRCGVDTTNIDVRAASDAGVLIVNVRAPFVDAVVDLTFGFVLCLARQIVAFDRTMSSNRSQTTFARQVASGQRDSLAGFEVCGRTLGVVGAGAIGRRMLEVAQAFGMETLVCDPLVPAAPSGARLVSLSDLLASSDFVSLHAPLNEASRHMIGAAELVRMKSTAFLINTARGALVEGHALAESLRSGTIAGAAVDVFETEPDLCEDPLMEDLPNLIRTPHIGGFTETVMTNQSRDVAQAIRDLAGGAIPVTTVNAEVTPCCRLLGAAPVGDLS